MNDFLACMASLHHPLFLSTLDQVVDVMSTLSRLGVGEYSMGLPPRICAALEVRGVLPTSISLS